MDSGNKEIVWQHDLGESKSNQNDVRIISRIEATIWRQAKQIGRFKDDPKTAETGGPKVIRVEEGLAWAEVL